MSGVAKGVAGLFVTVLTACSVIYGAFWCLISLRYFQVASQFGYWNYFALFYTFVTPAASVAGYFMFWFFPSLKTVTFSILACISVAAIYWIWAPNPFN